MADILEKNEPKPPTRPELDLFMDCCLDCAYPEYARAYAEWLKKFDAWIWS